MRPVDHNVTLRGPSDSTTQLPAQGRFEQHDAQPSTWSPAPSTSSPVAGGSESGREHRAVYASAMSPMRRRDPSIDDDPIDDAERRIALAL